jgi:hypothetical protein
MNITGWWMVEEFMGVSETYQTVVKSLSVGSLIPLMIPKVITVCREYNNNNSICDNSDGYFRQFCDHQKLHPALPFS